MPSTACAPPPAPPEPARRKRLPPTRTSGARSAPRSAWTATSSTSTTATSAPRRAPCRTPCGATWSTPTWGRITPWSPCWNTRWKACAAAWPRPRAATPRRWPSRATPRKLWRTRSTASISSAATKSSPPTRTIRACSPPSRSASAAKASCSKPSPSPCRHPPWTGGCERADRGGFVHSGARHDRDDRRVEALGLVLGHAFAAGFRRPVHEKVVDHLVGNGGEGAPAVARGPGVLHRPQCLAAAEPVLERGVRWDGEVGGEHAAADGPGRLRIGGRADEHPGDQFAVRAGLRAHSGHITG